MMTDPRSKVWRSRAMIVAIALITAVPFGVAWYYVRHPELIEARSNYGMLFNPPVAVDVAEILARPLGRSNEFPEIKGRWVLLQVAGEACAEPCASVLHKTHQVRLMLNKEIPRVRRVLLVPAGTSRETSSRVVTDDLDLLVAEAPPGLAQTLATALGRVPEPNTVVLMDPMGNLALWYEADFDPYRLLKDLKHLLKASQIG